MLYYKNVDIAEMYKVSPNTVGNWIDSAIERKINLQLHEKEGRFFILNSPHNRVVLKELSEKGKKYKNQISLKTIRPTPEFYKTYSNKEIIDIITSLEVNKEIDIKYTYFREGAQWWDNYIKNSLKTGIDTTIKSTIQLLQSNVDYIYSLVKNYKQVNIIDIGSGNAYPVRNFIQYFVEKKMLRKYIAIDYSPELLEMAVDNVNSWFKNQVEVESHKLDINHDTFRSILFANRFGSDTTEGECINIILFLGTTVENQRLYTQSLEIIKNSMGESDIFLLGHILDSTSSKQEITFNTENPKQENSDLDQLRLVLRLLNLDDSLYKIERLYTEEERSRVIRANLNYDIKIKFETKEFKKDVYFSHRDNIIFFRHRHHTFPEVVNILTNMDFQVLHATTSQVLYEQVLVISKLKVI